MTDEEANRIADAMYEHDPIYNSSRVRYQEQQKAKREAEKRYHSNTDWMVKTATYITIAGVVVVVLACVAIGIFIGKVIWGGN